jgi:hypothetical protein
MLDKFTHPGAEYPSQPKQLTQIVSTADGMEIDESDEQPEKPDFSIREAFESLSNARRESALHAQKQRSPILSTDNEIQIHESDDSPLTSNCTMQKRKLHIRQRDLAVSPRTCSRFEWFIHAALAR